MINATYLNPINTDQICEAFAANSPPSVQLREILDEKVLREIQKELQTAQWASKALYDEYSYEESELTPAARKVLASTEFIYLLQKITKTRVRKIKANFCSFAQGHYTLLLDKYHIRKQLYFEIEITAAWSSDWGGYTSFVEKEEILRINPIPNSLVLVESKAQRFVKYVTHQAEDRRIFICGTIK